MDRPTAETLESNTPFLTDPAAQKLCQTLEDAGFTALFVGGCVRNAIMGTAASDIDISTDALPDEVLARAQAAGLHAIPTGIDHGTVTIVVDGTPFEVTTFRRDVVTDGRRAVVAFSKDVAEDARRRDFTMNALYADRNGVILDPLGGLSDVHARRVRFIEDPGQRIREDYLRILRFFRFHAYYADQTKGWDADALDGIASNLFGLETLSAERVGSEMIKLLSAPDPTGALAVMDQIGVLACVLPGASVMFVGPLVHLESVLDAPADPMARLAALGGQEVAARLRLSRQSQKRLDSIREHCGSVLPAKAIGQVAGAEAGLGAILLRAAMANQPITPDIKAAVIAGSQTVFPISAKDLPELSGASLGKKLKTLKAAWLNSDLTKGKNELLAP